jgi:hypothetical protein
MPFIQNTNLGPYFPDESLEETIMGSRGRLKDVKNAL